VSGVLAVGSCQAAVGTAAPAGGLAWSDDPIEGRARLEDHGRPLLEYRYRAHDPSEAWRVNYVHPLYSPSAVVITEDRPADHPHQRGVFWAWRRIMLDGAQVADGWVGRGLQLEMQRPTLAVEEGTATLAVEVVWQTPAAAGFGPLVRENTLIRAHPVEGGVRRIEFETRLIALRPGVSLAGTDDEKGYGGFSIRLRDSGRLIVRSAGQEVTARVESQATAGDVEFAWRDAQAGFPQRLGIRCEVDGEPWRRWVLRQEPSMQNCAYPGRRPVALSVTRPTVLRTTLKLH
jgi:hypothetical protein